MSRSRARIEPSRRNWWAGPEEFKECVRAWAKRIGVEPSRVQIQRTTRKLGSCSKQGALTFSSDLLSRPREVGEAVIVHELIHLKVPNHGPVFRSLLRAMLPGAEDLLAQARLD